MLYIDVSVCHTHDDRPCTRLLLAPNSGKGEQSARARGGGSIYLMAERVQEQQKRACTYVHDMFLVCSWYVFRSILRDNIINNDETSKWCILKSYFRQDACALAHTPRHVVVGEAFDLGGVEMPRAPFKRLTHRRNTSRVAAPICNNGVRNARARIEYGQIEESVSNSK